MLLPVGAVLAQVAVDGKMNEITMLAPLLTRSPAWPTS